MPALLLVVIALLWPGAVAVADQKGPPEQALEAGIRATVEAGVLPALVAFDERVAGFDRATRALCETPGEGKLNAARDAWRALANAWARVGVLRFGPLTGGFPVRLAWRLDAYRMDRRPRAVEEAIEVASVSDVPIDAAYIESVSTFAKSLRAFERLLFDRPDAAGEALATFRDDPRRCAYLRGLSTAYVTDAAAFVEHWRDGDDPYAEELAHPGASGSEFFRTQDAVDRVMNAVITSLDVLTRDELGKPLGRDADNARPWVLASPVARHSAAEIEATLDGLAMLFFNRWQDRDGRGLDDALRDSGEAALVTRVEARFAAAREALAALPAPLVVSVREHRGAAERVLAELNRLKAVFKVDVANALWVTLDFNATDGD